MTIDYSKGIFETLSQGTTNGDPIALECPSLDSTSFNTMAVFNSVRRLRYPFDYKTITRERRQVIFWIGCGLRPRHYSKSYSQSIDLFACASSSDTFLNVLKVSRSQWHDRRQDPTRHHGISVAGRRSTWCLMTPFQRKHTTIHVSGRRISAIHEYSFVRGLRPVRLVKQPSFRRLSNGGPNPDRLRVGALYGLY